MITVTTAPDAERASGRLTVALSEALSAATAGAVAFDVQLARISRWRIGGSALAVVEPGSTAELSRVRAVLAEAEIPSTLVGDTSNLLFDSQGFDGVLIRIGRRLSRFTIEDRKVWSQAGTSVPTLSRAAGAKGLTGIEHTVGIPGTLGGLVVMNGGSQRKGIGQHVESVIVVHADGAVSTLNQGDCAFGYRSSTLQSTDAAVSEVVLQLEHSTPDAVRREMRTVMLDRLGKFPSHQPNCGSTFLSDPAMYATVGPPGRALEAAGLKGLRRGDAVVSERHANFIVNAGNATSDDVLWLIHTMRSTVEKRTGYAMDCEARFLARDGRLVPAHEAAIARWGRDAVAAEAR